jgi:hypothetical protein
LLIDIHYCPLRLHNPLRAVLRYKSGISRSSSATRHRHRPDRLSLSRGLSSQTLSWVSERQPKQKTERNLAIRHPPSAIRHPPSAIAINTGVFASTIGGRRRRYHCGTDSRSTATRIQVDPSTSAHLLLLAARTTSTPPSYNVAGVTISTYTPPYPSLVTRDDHLLTVPDTLLSHTPSYPSPNSKWSHKMSRLNTSWGS